MSQEEFVLDLCGVKERIRFNWNELHSLEVVHFIKKKIAFDVETIPWE